MSVVIDAYPGFPGSPATRLHNALVAGIQDDDWVVVVAAGNHGRGLGGVASYSGAPAYHGQMIVAGALERAEPSPGMADFSNTAYIADTEYMVPHYLVAPGVYVCAGKDVVRVDGDYVQGCNYPSSAQIDAGMTSDDPNDALTYFSGTSAAAPIITGAVARIRRANPDMSAAAIVALLMDTATDFGEPGYDGIYGAGLINLEAALAAAPFYVYEPPKNDGQPSVARVQYARAAGVRAVPGNAVQIGDDSYMVPSTPAPNGCMMFAPFSQHNATDTGIYWRNARGEFSLSPADCLVVKDRVRG